MVGWLVGSMDGWMNLFNWNIKWWLIKQFSLLSYKAIDSYTKVLVSYLLFSSFTYFSLSVYSWWLNVVCRLCCCSYLPYILRDGTTTSTGDDNALTYYPNWLGNKQEGKNIHIDGGFENIGPHLHIKMIEFENLFN